MVFVAQVFPMKPIGRTYRKRESKPQENSGDFLDIQGSGMLVGDSSSVVK